MCKTIIIIIFGFLILPSTAHSDTVNMKSGEILEGTLLKNKNPMPRDGWCAGEDDIGLRKDGISQCLHLSDIESFKKEYIKPEGIELLADDNKWGEEKYGYRTQLIPVNKQYVIGQPMTFHLLLKNVSEDTKWYDNQSVEYKSLLIKDGNGDEVYNKQGPFQTIGFERPIASGEIVPIMQNKDITEEYLIKKEGKYTIQFREGNYGNPTMDSTFPASNIIEFEIRSGEPSNIDILISAMEDIAPEKRWELSPGGDNKVPLGRSEVAGKLLVFARHPESGLKVDVVTVLIWQTDSEAKIVERKNNDDGAISEFLGLDSEGRYYYIYASERAKTFWPSVKDDIIAALNLNTQ